MYILNVYITLILTYIKGISNNFKLIENFINMIYKRLTFDQIIISFVKKLYL